MESATREGLKILSGIINYCQNNDERISSDRAFARHMESHGHTGVKGNAQSIGRMKKAWEAPSAQKFTQETLYRVADYLWIPGSELRDSISGEDLGRLKFSGEELRAVIEGRCHLCTLEQMAAMLNGDSLSHLPPLIAEIERRRRERRHSYRDLCEACLIPPVDATNIRRLLAFSGWFSNVAITYGYLLSLSRYLADISPGQSIEEQSVKLQAASRKLADLLLKSQR